MGVNLCPERDALLTEFGKQTLSDRYLRPGESYQEAFARVAEAFADDDAHAQRMYDHISRLWFMPATPVLANGGTGRNLPISCYLSKADDTLSSILGTFNEMANLSCNGGGIGIDWSAVRELGAKGRVTSEGVIPLQVIQNGYTRWANQGDTRNASSASYLDIHHPEIEEFLEIRKPVGDLGRKALAIHIGVTISDEFMEAVRTGNTYFLTSRTTGEVVKELDARTIWEKILDMRSEKGEPYLLFVDNANAGKSPVYDELGLDISQSNLCSEIMLHTGRDHLGGWRTAVCCLSSVNLTYFDEWSLDPLFIEDCLRFLDNVIQDFIDRTEGVPGFENARYAAMRERAVGLGVMGFHTYLMDHHIVFDGVMAKVANLKVFRHIKAAGDAANHKLAAERGVCPDAYDAVEKAKSEGRPYDHLMVRFTNWSAIAPTASISGICGEASPGIEPVPAMEWVQKGLSGTFLLRCRPFEEFLADWWSKNHEDVRDHWSDQSAFEADVWAYVHEHEGSIQGFPMFTEVETAPFKTAFEIDQRWVVDLAADRGPLVTQGQSVNVFFPGDADKGYINEVHRRAHKSGTVKALYYMRSTSVEQAGAQPVGSDSVGVPDASYEALEECLSCQ